MGRRAGAVSLRFGTSGIPLTTRRPGTEHGIRRAREPGPECLEMAWGNGRDARASGWVVAETPAMEKDALRLRRHYGRIT